MEGARRLPVFIMITVGDSPVNGTRPASIFKDDHAQ